jgi:hypothetical protein
MQNKESIKPIVRLQIILFFVFFINLLTKTTCIEGVRK